MGSQVENEACSVSVGVLYKTAYCQPFTNPTHTYSPAKAMIVHMTWVLRPNSEQSLWKPQLWGDSRGSCALSLHHFYPGVPHLLPRYASSFQATIRLINGKSDTPPSSTLCENDGYCDQGESRDPSDEQQPAVQLESSLISASSLYLEPALSWTHLKIASIPLSVCTFLVLAQVSRCVLTSSCGANLI